MPAGDAQRAWFPEMLQELKSHWSHEMTWEELAVFCRDMTEWRRRIKEARKIGPPMRCKKCGGDMVLPPVSIRSALFALHKVSAIDEAQLKVLDRRWGKHRQTHGLDAYGNPSKAGLDGDRRGSLDIHTRKCRH